MVRMTATKRPNLLPQDSQWNYKLHSKKGLRNKAVLICNCKKLSPEQPPLRRSILCFVHVPQVVHLQETREELLGERNFAAQLANDIHSSRLRIVAMGNSLLTATDPHMKKFKEEFRKEADIINGQIMALDDRPVLQSVLFGEERGFTTPPV
jgi:hypothetical protein